MRLDISVHTKALPYIKSLFGTTEHTPSCYNETTDICLHEKLLVNMFPTVNVIEHNYCRMCHMPASSDIVNPACDCTEFDRFVSVPIAPQLRELIRGNKNTLPCFLHVLWFSL